MKPAFTQWFGDSKVVHAEGEPLVVFHGTRNSFTTFDEDAIAHFGFHFGTKTQAQKFGEQLMACHLAIKNPIRLPDLGMWDFENLARNLDSRGLGIINGSDYERAWACNDQNAELRKILLEKGYDGIVYRNEVEGAGDSFIALRADQVKSVDTALESASDAVAERVLFHGTATKFEVFTPSTSGFYGAGSDLWCRVRQVLPAPIILHQAKKRGCKSRGPHVRSSGHQLGPQLLGPEQHPDF